MKLDEELHVRYTQWKSLGGCAIALFAISVLIPFQNGITLFNILQNTILNFVVRRDYPIPGSIGPDL